MSTTILRNAANNRVTLAYNTRAIPYDHGITNRVQYLTLKANKLSSKALANLTEALVAPPLTLTPEEQSLQGGVRVVWVGMCLPKVDPKAINGFVLLSKRTSITTGNNTTVIPTHPGALRVVVDLRSAQNKFSALVNQDNGLCEGFRVNLKDCYFFDEFRDDGLTSDAQREASWANKVREWRVSSTAKDSNEDTRQASTRSIVANYVDVPRQHSFKNEIAAYAALYEMESAARAVEALRASLMRYENDLKSRPAATFTSNERDARQHNKHQSHMLLYSLPTLYSGTDPAG